eukprot:TRINITY_DN12546_c0_g4_i1.p1 TRINITY_DN12546_c0_g4~~TRINITY_DN12546_c0_g4_i1.p1  ORF type:complete len:202 (+),score=51.82 TRINITY_DN12546_c0_g4_i1:192-797(+)
MISKAYRVLPYTGAMARFNSDLLTRIKNQEQGVYEPEVQEHRELDLNKQYITTTDTSLLSLYGLKGKPERVNTFENSYMHLKDLSLLHSEHMFSSSGHMNRIEDEEYMHEQPYGYLVGDDPFERNTTHNLHGMKVLLIYLAVWMFVSMSKIDYGGKRKAPRLTHAILTGSMLEGKMREVRRKEWSLRQQIAEADQALAKLK